MINEKEISDCLKSLFLCTGRIRRLAAELHAPRAASREINPPYSIAQGRMRRLAAEATRAPARLVIEK